MSHKKPLTIFSSEGFGASNSDILAKYIVVSRETRIKTDYVMKYIYSIVIFTIEFLIICAYVYYQLLLIFQIKSYPSTLSDSFFVFFLLSFCALSHWPSRNNSPIMPNIIAPHIFSPSFSDKYK